MLFENEHCNNGIHVFLSSKSKSAPQNPTCIYCGGRVVNWERVRKRDPADIEFVISELHKEKERYDIWMTDVDLRAKNHALRKGRLEFKNYVKKRIFQMIGRVYDLGGPIKKPYRDGYQTPFSGNLVYYAQHATACCCRPCAERWHGIPQGRDLTDEEIDYLSKIIMIYIEQKLPGLQDEGIYVPPIRKPKLTKSPIKQPVPPIVEQIPFDLNSDVGE